MSLFKSEYVSLTSANVASVNSLGVGALNLETIHAQDLEVHTFAGTSLYAGTMNATTATVANAAATMVVADTVNATTTTFVNLPTCATQPTAANELANKAYVDAAAGGGGGGGGGVETVTGTNPISATVETTLLSGSTHALPAGTTVGAKKVIINMNPSTMRPVAPLGIYAISSIGNINNIVVDVNNQRVYVQGIFQQFNQVTNATKIVYYDLILNEWKPLGVGCFVNQDSLNAIVVVGDNVFSGGNLYSLTAGRTWGVLGGDVPGQPPQKVARWNKNDGKWYPLQNNAIATSIGYNQSNGTINHMLLVGTTIYIMGQIQWGNPNYYRGIFAYDISTDTFSHIPAGSNGNSGPVNYSSGTTPDNSLSSLQVTRAQLIGTKLYIIGNFGRVRNAGVEVANTRFLAAYDTSSLTWEAVGTAIFNAVPQSIAVYNGKLVIQGGFTSYGATSIVGCALWDPVQNTMVQFPVISAAFTGSSNLYVDPVTNDLWATSTANLNATNDPASPSASNGQRNLGLAKFNSVTQVWEPYIFAPNCSLIARVSSGKYWVATFAVLQSTSIVDNVVPGVDGLLELDLASRQVVSTTGVFGSNSSTWQNLHFFHQYQSVSLINVDNTKWVVTADNSTAMGASSMAPVFFF